MTEKGKRPPRWHAAERRGQAAARGQFALFEKVGALKRCYQKRGAGSKEQRAMENTEHSTSNKSGSRE